MRSPAPSKDAPRVHRVSFSLRLFASLLATMAAIGATQYVLTARQLTERVSEQAAAAHESDARVLQSLDAEAAKGDWAPVNELLGHIAARPGVEHVAVVDPDGHIAAVGVNHGAAKGGHGKAAMPMDDAKPAGHGKAAMPMDDAKPAGHGKAATVGKAVDTHRRAAVADVIASGGTSAGGDPALRGGKLYVVPVDLKAGRHALVVSKIDKTLAAQLSDMRWVLLLTLGVGVLIAFPIFYLLGGRSLAARYQVAHLRSSRDALTGLGNHRSFHEDLRRNVEIAQRRGGTVSLAMVDVDHFKQVNDTHGHGHGDAVLTRIAELLSSGRSDDGAYRVGGDEFAVVLPNTTTDEATIVLERIRARVAEELDVVTTSIGIAQLGQPAGDAETLLACADLALYEAKDAGRNCVRVPRATTAEPVAERRAV